MAVVLGDSVLMVSSAIDNVSRARGRIAGFCIPVLRGLYLLGGMFMGYIASRVAIPWTLARGGSLCVMFKLLAVPFPPCSRDAVSLDAR